MICDFRDYGPFGNVILATLFKYCENTFGEKVF